MTPIAFGPREVIALIFDDRSNKIRAGGNRCLVVQLYSIESFGIIPMLVLSIGKRYTHITGGVYLNRLSNF